LELAATVSDRGGAGGDHPLIRAGDRNWVALRDRLEETVLHRKVPPSSEGRLGAKEG
jgi:hypothetical protein